MNLRPFASLSEGEERAIIASVQGAAEASDRLNPRPPSEGFNDRRQALSTGSPHDFGITAQERGVWDRLRAQGFSDRDAANIIRTGRK